MLVFPFHSMVLDRPVCLQSYLKDVASLGNDLSKPYVISDSCPKVIDN
jgi:hypothetical protein